MVALDKIGEINGLNTHRSDAFTDLRISSAYNWNINFPNNYASFEQEGMNERTARAIAEKTIADTVAAFKLIKEDTLHEEARKRNIQEAENRKRPILF